MNVDPIIAAESGGNPNLRNPRSSATGAGQFINSTWLSMVAKYRPDLAQGKSKEEILALRTDPQLSKDMVDAYAKENAGVLTGAGFEASPGNTYLAHFAGPQGAVKVLGADPTAPVGGILGDAAVTANPFLRGMSAGDLIAWAQKKMGGTAPAMPAYSWSPQGATPAAQASAVPSETVSPSGLLGALPAAGGFSGADLSGLSGVLGGMEAPQPMQVPGPPPPYFPRVNYKRRALA